MSSEATSYELSEFLRTPEVIDGTTWWESFPCREHFATLDEAVEAATARIAARTDQRWEPWVNVIGHGVEANGEPTGWWEGWVEPDGTFVAGDYENDERLFGVEGDEASLAACAEYRRRLRIDAAVARGRREIAAHIAEGHIPATIQSFREVDEHTDLNVYGGLCDEGWEWTADNSDERAVQAGLDAWIRAGRPDPSSRDGASSSSSSAPEQDSGGAFTAAQLLAAADALRTMADPESGALPCYRVEVEIADGEQYPGDTMQISSGHWDADDGVERTYVSFVGRDGATLEAYESN